MPQHASYPARIAETPRGPVLVAATGLPAGTMVARFEGPVCSSPRDIDDGVRYAPWIGPDRWLVPRSDARFLRHSCRPNCTLLPSRDVALIRPVDCGEELTVAYDAASLSSLLLHPERAYWDPRWTFQCGCGESGCPGLIDRYRFRDRRGNLLPQAQIDRILVTRRSGNGAAGSAVPMRVGPSPGKGRGVFMVEAVPAGTLLERAPVVVFPIEQREHLDRTVLTNYWFGWGDDGEVPSLPLGLTSMCNHSYQPNALYLRRPEETAVQLWSIAAIAAGEEVTTNYNGDPDDRSPLWFEPLPEG